VFRYFFVSFQFMCVYVWPSLFLYECLSLYVFVHVRFLFLYFCVGSSFCLFGRYVFLICCLMLLLAFCHILCLCLSVLCDCFVVRRSVCLSMCLSVCMRVGLSVHLAVYFYYDHMHVCYALYVVLLWFLRLFCVIRHACLYFVRFSYMFTCLLLLRLFWFLSVGRYVLLYVCSVCVAIVTPSCMYYVLCSFIHALCSFLDLRSVVSSLCICVSLWFQVFSYFCFMSVCLVSVCILLSVCLYVSDMSLCARIVLLFRLIVLSFRSVLFTISSTH